MRPGTQLIYRLVDVLKGLAQANEEGIGMTALAEETGLAGPTVHRMLQAMVDVGLAYQNPDNRRYVLGTLLVELGRKAGKRFDIEALASEQIETLAQTTGDTAFFLMRKGSDMHCLASASGSFPIKTLITEVGMHRPIGMGASGLAVLASLPDSEALALIETNTPRFIEEGYSPDDIAKEVAQARVRGYVVRVIPELGATTIAMAVRDKQGHPFASVSTSSISQRMMGAHLSDVLSKIQSVVLHIEAQIDFDSRRLLGLPAR